MVIAEVELFSRGALYVAGTDQHEMNTHRE